jgi:hypothetical protein
MKRESLSTDQIERPRRETVREVHANASANARYVARQDIIPVATASIPAHVIASKTKRKMRMQFR